MDNPFTETPQYSENQFTTKTRSTEKALELVVLPEDGIERLGLCNSKLFSPCFRGERIRAQLWKRAGEKARRSCAGDLWRMISAMTCAVIGASRIPSR